MILPLAAAALLIGLAAGPHCAAMCGPACGGVIRIVREGQPGDHGLQWSFHAGRLLGYALAGAAVAQAVQGLAWAATHAAALRPLWTVFHVAVLGWGLALLASGRQPALATATGRKVWQRLRPLATPPQALFATGVLWALMPCGLLYSALLVASLSGGPLAGAFTMALFALGSAVSLLLAPRMLRLAGERGGARLAGALIAAAAAWALWMDLSHRIAEWCGLA
ncbi:sulfite exporter TauE/SafE family protein [Ramlibacter sp. XY19]|uniref:sulfite exporter TauE/SafE family protein n=1 Tax=Ramlibacter paludis TaxID=2908000 RepID=UPI0023D9B905|nr:sulfite exporter TauE/SafE family protein [Ramlibacter paludis]